MLPPNQKAPDIIQITCRWDEELRISGCRDSSLLLKHSEAADVPEAAQPSKLSQRNLPPNVNDVQGIARTFGPSKMDAIRWGIHFTVPSAK